MKHPSLQQLMEFADGALDSSSADPIDIHLRSCPECSARYASHRSTAALIRRAGNVELSPYFAEVTSRKISERSHSEREWTAVEKTAEKFLATIALVVVLLLSFMPADRDQAQETADSQAGLFSVFIQDTTLARLAANHTVNRDDVLETVLYKP